MEHYPDAFEHLREELQRFTLLLRRAVLINRARHGNSLPDSLAGQIVESSEVDALLRHEDLLAARWHTPEGNGSLAAQISSLDGEADRRRRKIDAKAAASCANGLRLPLVRLCDEFELTAFDLDVLLLALAPELDPAFERIYAELHDDVTRTRPSVDLALQVSCRNEIEKLRALTRLSPAAPLLRHRFLTLAEFLPAAHATLLRRALLPDESIVHFVLGQAPGVLTAGRLMAAPAGSAQGVARATRDQLDRFVDAATRHLPDRFTLVLHGDRRELQIAAALYAAGALARPLLFLELTGAPPSETSLITASRDAVLWDAILTVGHPPDTSDPPPEGQRKGTGLTWPAELASANCAFIHLAPAGQLPPASAATVVWSIDVEPPEYAERIEVWKGGPGSLVESEARFLADSFQFSDDQIRRAQHIACGRAALRDPSDPRVDAADLLAASRQLAAPQLNRFAIPLKPRYTWHDIVFPPARLAQLRSIADRVKARSQVLRDWGFGAKHARGNGMNVLFTGASGTGKTMAAEVLANELSLHLFQIDVSCVVSKYVGETEKHLATLFDEAEFGNALLFFDEADSLFGKRTELKDAHDRYANIEVNFLLQRIERYQGLVVLSTNLQKNMDEAFLRRLHEVVDFPFPDEAARAAIWRRQLPDAAPCDPAIDFDFLSRRFKLSGGNINNAARNAAYFAAAARVPIGMTHLVRAVRDEYLKLGRLILEPDFEPYFSLIQEGRTAREVPA